MNLEAAELLELFQWSGSDLDEIRNEKVSKNEAKYPVEKAWGSAAKYTELT